jgi:hypothetical protein
LEATAFFDVARLLGRCWGFIQANNLKIQAPAMVFLMPRVGSQIWASVPSSRLLLCNIELTACLNYFSTVADRELTGLFN